LNDAKSKETRGKDECRKRRVDVRCPAATHSLLPSARAKFVHWSTVEKVGRPRGQELETSNCDAFLRSEEWEG